MLAHLISFENELARSGGMLKVYKKIRKELEKYGNDLDKKEEIIVLTKTDVIEDEKIIDKKKKEFEKLKKPVFVISLYDDKSIKEFSDNLIKILKSK